MTESKGGLSSQAREFVAVGASVGAGCHPCVTHHLKAGAGAGLSAQALLAAITAAERVSADAPARMAQHARRQLLARAGNAEANGTVREATLAALGAAVAANSMPNINRYLTEAAELGVSRDELADAVNAAHEVQQNAARIHARLTGKLLDTPLPKAPGQPTAAPAGAGQADGCDESCPCHDEDASAGTGLVAARGAPGMPMGACAPTPAMLSGCCDAMPA